MSDDNRSWTDTVAATARSAADKARSAAPETYDRTAQAANYIGETIREYPLSGSVAVALLGYALGFLLHHEWSDTGSARYSRGRDSRSWTDAAATAQSAADRARSTASETYNRAAQARESFGGSIQQYALPVVAVAALLGYALGFLSKREPASPMTGEYDSWGRKRDANPNPATHHMPRT